MAASMESAWLRVTSLQSQRDDLLNEIALLRARGPFPALAKATTLLTRLWDRATWVSREEILQAARVFVHIGRVQIAMAIPKHGRRDKRKPRKRRGSAKNPSKKLGRATPTVTRMPLNVERRVGMIKAALSSVVLLAVGSRQRTTRNLRTQRIALVAPEQLG